MTPLPPLLRWLRAAALALFLVFVLSPDAWSGKRKGWPEVVEDARAFATTDRAKAVELLETAIADGPSKRELQAIKIEAGEQRRLSGEVDEARRWFDEVLAATKKGPDRDAARLGIALLDAQDGVGRKLLKVLGDVNEKSVPPTMNADRYLVIAADAATRGENGRVTANSRRALNWAVNDPEVLTRIEATLAALADTPPEQTGDVLVGPPVGTGSLLDKAEAAWAAGDREQALSVARKAAKSNDEALRMRAEHLVTALEGPAADRNRIVVILPLSGKYEAVGKQVREALEFGYGTGPRRLEFVDSGATAESATAALEQAVAGGAIAAVGPLLSDEVEAMVSTADRLNVPLLTLSQSYEDTLAHRWTIQAMYTRGDQVGALLDYTTGERGMKAFAMFSPDSDFGTDAAALFEAGAAEHGARITTKATYKADEKNLLPFAKELGQREGNLYELRKLAEEQGGNPDTVVLPPKIDFEAIFLPESARRTPLACAALAFEEFPMGEFTPKKDSPEIPLLGLSTWNTESLVTAGNEYTRNSLFTDVFSPVVAGEDDPFVTAYRRQTGRTPSALEAATVDAGKLLAAAARSEADNRAAFRSALLSAEVTNTITGATGFNPETRRARRTMQILTITRETVEKVAEVTLDGA